MSHNWLNGKCCHKAYFWLAWINLDYILLLIPMWAKSFWTIKYFIWHEYTVSDSNASREYHNSPVYQGCLSLPGWTDLWSSLESLFVLGLQIYHSAASSSSSSSHSDHPDSSLYCWESLQFFQCHWRNHQNFCWSCRKVRDWRVCCWRMTFLSWSCGGQCCWSCEGRCCEEVETSGWCWCWWRGCWRAGSWWGVLLVEEEQL